MAKYYWRGGATGTWNGKPRPWPPHKIFNCEELMLTIKITGL